MENARGNRVLEKMAAVREGTLRRSLDQNGSRVDQNLWGVLQHDWRQGELTPYAVEPSPAAPELPGGTVVGPTRGLPAWCDGPPVLPGRLGTLRELAPTDHASLLPMLSDSEVQRYTFAPPETPEQFEHFHRWGQAARKAGRYLCYGIVPADSLAPVGMIQLRALEPSFLTAEWGFALGRPYWGTGLFQEMATHFLDFAFDTIGVLRLEARSAMANRRACRVLARLGSVFEGSLRQSFLTGGTYLDDALYALLADDWRRMRVDAPGPRETPRVA